ncbi:hypothetical protein [Streptomyces sp. NBC_01718]|uniref:hypothetical protein n=1 Tax=Streptomyces sp. NBC_01718 TaxID=2975919 RepID=UPI00352DF631
MAPRTRNPGSEWLALSAPDPLQIHRLWAREQLAPIPSGRLWLAVEVGLMRSVDAMQRIGSDGLGPVLVYPSAELAWWLVPPGGEELLADLSRLTVRSKGWMLRCPSADRYIDGLGWLEKPDGSGRLTDPAALGAAFGPGGHRLQAGAFC